MTTQRDPHGQAHNTQVFNTVAAIDLNDRDPGKRGGWRSDARLEVLAHELVRYMPDLADALVRSGKVKMAA